MLNHALEWVLNELILCSLHSALTDTYSTVVNGRSCKTTMSFVCSPFNTPVQSSLINPLYHCRHSTRHRHHEWKLKKNTKQTFVHIFARYWPIFEIQNKLLVLTGIARSLVCRVECESDGAAAATGVCLMRRWDAMMLTARLRLTPSCSQSRRQLIDLLFLQTIADYFRYY